MQTFRYNPAGFVLALAILSIAAGLVGGCASRAWNEGAAPQPEGLQYNFANRLPRANAQDTFVVLAFSGGGTRSAAFSYGVLETLRDTPVTIGGVETNLLKEVDVITSVSGGSYTAAYYGLFGDRIFHDFERRFLKRDVQGELIATLLNPYNALNVLGPYYNRADLAAAWFSRNLFENRTYRDMGLGELPFVIVNASDLNTGSTFSFIQQQFDFLCSDLTNYPVGSAVMASSAVPVLFGTVSVRNFDNDCTSRRNSWVPGVLRNPDILSRDYQVAKALERYFDPKRMPVVRLVDGGVTDNLGVRGSIMSPVAHYGNVMEMRGAFTISALSRVTKVLVIVANAQVYPEYDWSRSGTEPGIVPEVLASFDAALNIMNTETVSLAKEAFLRWAAHINATRGNDKPPVEVTFVVLTFDGIREIAERRYFNAIPTTLSLSGEQVDRVRGLARKLLTESSEFKTFRDSLD